MVGKPKEATNKILDKLTGTVEDLKKALEDAELNKELMAPAILSAAKATPAEANETVAVVGIVVGTSKGEASKLQADAAEKTAGPKAFVKRLKGMLAEAMKINLPERGK